MRRLVFIPLVGCVFGLTVGLSSAQVPAVPPAQPPGAQAPVSTQPIPGIDTARQWRLERLGPDHWKLTGDVEVEKDNAKFYADEMEIFTDRDLLTAKGNVVLTTPDQRISADRLEFNLTTKLGVFYNASGIARLAQPDQIVNSQFGAQEPDVYFYGDVLSKIGDRKYRITKGGFTTCVQPTPRWELTSGTVILNLDHYAILRNSLFKVKSIPVLYLPVVYYPINKDDRATGFLLPIYGTSTLRGQTLSNAFFWAINRSHDVTVLHDWYSRTGQGFGSEYRYVLSPLSQGTVRWYSLNEKPTTYLDETGKEVPVTGRKSFEVRGNATQSLPGKLRAGLRMDYFSDITVQQTYNTNIFNASRRQRYIGGNVAGTWGSYTLGAAVDRSQYFFDDLNSTVSGSLPRVNVARGERPIGRTPIYFSLNGEYANAVRETIRGDTTYESGLHRIDALPTVRFPFTKLAFLTVNSSLSWRYTWWSESLDPVTRQQVPVSVSRSFFDMQARIVGPVFNRIWNTNSGYAEKIKHSIEPYVVIRRTTAIDVYSQIVQLDSTDYIVGQVTQYTYGVNNRVWAKRPTGPEAGRAREVLNVGLRQSYYTDARAASLDGSYFTNYPGGAPSKFSPIQLTVRSSPVDGLNAQFGTEYDQQFGAFRSFGASGTYDGAQWISATAGWSQRRYIEGLPGYDNPASLTHALNAEAHLRFNQNRYGGHVSFNWDIQNERFLQRRFIGYYNVQCCGFAVEFQTWDFTGINYGTGIRPPVTQDRRFNIAITLAGIGTFSNFFGALGGGSGR